MTLTWRGKTVQSEPPIKPDVIIETFFVLRDRYQRQDSAPLSMILRFKNLLELNVLPPDKTDISEMTPGDLEYAIEDHPCFEMEEEWDTSPLVFCDIDALRAQAAPLDTEEGARIRGAAVMAFGTLLNEEGGPLWIGKYARKYCR